MNFEELTTTYLARIDELVGRVADPKHLAESGDRATVEGVFVGTLTIVEAIYGGSSAQAKSLVDTRKSFSKTQYSSHYELESLAKALSGILANVREELKLGLVKQISDEAAGEVIGDLIALARKQLSAGFKDVAAVLASAALEDALKRKANDLGIAIEGKTMDSVINALKAKSFFKGAQAAIVSSYVKLRNASMHADWDKIDSADVSSLLGFLDVFVLQHFS